MSLYTLEKIRVRHILKDIVPHGLDARLEEIEERHQRAIKEKDNQIQALEFTNGKHQQKVLELNKEIDDLIENRHIARRGCFDNVLCFIKKIAEKFIHITLFDVSIGSLKNISDGLSFVTQTWRCLSNTTIPMLFISGIGSSVK